LQNRQLKRQHRSIYGTDPEVEKKIDKNDKSLQLAYKKMAAKKYGMTQPKVNATEEVETIDELTGDLLARASDAAFKNGKPEQSANLGAGAYKRGISSDFMKNKSRFADDQKKIDGARMTKLGEDLKASDPVGKWIDDFVHSDNPRFNGKTKEERRKMALGAYYAAQKESYENSTEELAEGRGRPPKEGSKAWHAAQAKASSGEASDQEADKNIVNQMRKKPVGDMHHLVFANGEKKTVHVKHVNKALSMLANTPKPADREKLQSSLSHSHKRFMDTITSGKAVMDAPKAKVSLGKMKAEEYVIEYDVVTSDKKPQKSTVRVMPDGSVKLVKYTPPKTELNIEAKETLNNLYKNLSEENKILFNTMLETEQGVESLLDFATEQGY
jgi:hypothetical protein